MSDTTPERQDRHFEVQVVIHPYATSAEEAYLLAVDSLIREGTDGFHFLITDVETGEASLMTQEGMVTGEALQDALVDLRRQFDEATGAGDTDQG